MITTIIAAVLILAAIATTFIKIPTGETRFVAPGRPNEPIYVPRAIAPVVLGLIALIVLAFSCTTIVQAKQVGVVTTFGKPTGTLSSGLHIKAPWQKVTQIDATIQTDEYHGDSGIVVRLGDGNTATVSATIRWSVSGENADEVYANFRSDDPTASLRDAVVSTQFKAATNAVFATFDPLTLAGATEQKPDYSALADAIESEMLKRTDDLVTIESVTISLLALDEQSQRKIDDYIAEVAKTRIAQQAQETAKAQAEANRIISESISNDPNVLVDKCLSLVADGASLPAGFTCWPGSGSAVVLPSTK